MSRNTPPDVAALVEQFFDRRGQGRRVSVDEVLAEVGAEGDARTRAAVINNIARRVQSSSAAASCTTDTSQSSLIPAAPMMTEVPGYDLIEEIGRGGMGVVVEAYQQSTGRRVAVKLISEQCLASDAARWRFEREVELAARLQHPNIVSVMDSGIHQGRYFYVMEYVEGRTLDRWIADCGLGIGDVRTAGRPRSAVQKESARRGEKSAIEAILHLVAQIADAVDDAHHQGVLHRDLKPNNILIVGHDRTGPGHKGTRGTNSTRGAHPKILDFGLAKDLDPLADGRRVLTVAEPGQLLGTLAYMAPEQARGAHDQTSVRSDVYSLGAIGYEAVTGCLPCPTDGALHKVLDRIQKQDPPRPSALRPGIPADVDAILLKALDKVPERRYGTAGELAADLRRWLNNEPVMARPASRFYQFRKFARRNRTLVGGVAAALALLFLGTVGTSWQAYRATVAGRRAVAQRDRAQALADMFLGLIRTQDDLAVRAGDPTDFRAQANAALERIRSEFSDDPQVIMAAYGLAGAISYSAQDPAGSESLYRTYAALKEAHLGPDHASTLLSQADVGSMAIVRGRLSEGEQILTDVLARQRAISGDLHPETLIIQANLAYGLEQSGQWGAAETMYRQILDASGEVFGATHPFTRRCMLLLAGVLGRQEKAAQFAEVLQEVLPLQRAQTTETQLIDTLGNLVTALTAQGRFEAAEPFVREELELAERTYPAADVRVTGLRAVYGNCLRHLGRYAEAEPLLTDAYAGLCQTIGDGHSWTKENASWLVQLYQAWGRPDDAARYQALMDIPQPPPDQAVPDEQ